MVQAQKQQWREVLSTCRNALWIAGVFLVFMVWLVRLDYRLRSLETHSGDGMNQEQMVKAIRMEIAMEHMVERLNGLRAEVASLRRMQRK